MLLLQRSAGNRPTTRRLAVRTVGNSLTAVPRMPLVPSLPSLLRARAAQYAPSTALECLFPGSQNGSLVTIKHGDFNRHQTAVFGAANGK